MRSSPRKRSSRRCAPLFGLAPSATTVFVAVFLVLLPILHSAIAEYTWNGTEWVWNEEVSPLTLRVLIIYVLLMICLSIVVSGEYK